MFSTELFYGGKLLNFPMPWKCFGCSTSKKGHHVIILDSLIKVLNTQDFKTCPMEMRDALFYFVSFIG